MTLHHLPSHVTQHHHTALSQLTQGETAMANAPFVTLANGYSFIPQHYLRYQHNVESIQQIMADIDYADNALLFAAEDITGMYIQVGLIGRENYDRGHQVRPQKLVYGRKWRINSDTPTSEIIQTAFLAIKKAKEHEVRELLTLIDTSTAKVSTPFSNHLDLALMTKNQDFLQSSQLKTSELNISVVAEYLEGVTFGERQIAVDLVEQRRQSQYLVDVSLGDLPLVRQAEGHKDEFEGTTFTLILSDTTRAALLYALTDVLIAHSDNHVENHFRYQGYRRFSRDNDPEKIAALSIASRPYARDSLNTRFNTGFKKSNYETDAARVPDIGDGSLAVKNRARIAAYVDLQGHLPLGYDTQMMSLAQYR